MLIPTAYEAAAAMSSNHKTKRPLTHNDPLYKSARKCTQWILPLYTSELSILLALPVLLALSETPPDATGTKEPFTPENVPRYGYWWELLWNRQRRRLALQRDPQARIYEFQTLMVWMTWIRMGLVLSWLVLITHSMDNVVAELDTEQADTTKAIFSARLSKIGWYCFSASLVVQFFMYSLHRTHLAQSLQNPTLYGIQGEVSLPWFFFAKFSIFNFVLNMTAWGVPSVMMSKVLVLLLNFSAGIVMVFTLRLEHPIEKCWGCYPPNTALADLKYGPCPAFYTDPEQAYAPVCTQPGVRCGFEELRWRGILSHYITISSSLMALSIAIYFTTIYNEIKYYLFEHDRATIMAKKRV